jgi:DNA methyltransferase 1-associated protein 1
MHANKRRVAQPFTNQARTDGLILKHWRRKPTSLPISNGEENPMEEQDTADGFVEDSSEFLKYAIKPDMPDFTDEEYDAHLRSDDWSREETDYLFQMISDYSYRWPVVWDRYDYQPSQPLPPSADNPNPTDILPFAPPKARSVEDIKARFYSISAKLMKLRIPEVQMDASQYTLYETLSKFDPVLERNRKTLAAALMNRNMDEVKEEEFLLAELQRINMAANRLDAEREELRSRLEAPTPNPNPNVGLTSFTSSQALAQLFSQLFQADRSKKRASGTGGGAGPGRLSLSATELMTPGSAHPGSLSSANRRQSLAQPALQTPIRQLSPGTEYKFNVSTHERLTSGVTFGADKLLKMRQAKSNVQTQKIGQALAQLGVSEVISIPTARVGDVFENLIGKVGRLLDVRKVREKEEGECRVLEAMKARRMSELQDENGNPRPGPSREISDSQFGGNSVNDNDEDEDDADGDADTNADRDANSDNEADDNENGDEDQDNRDEEDEDMDAEGDLESGMQSTRQPSEVDVLSTRGMSQGHKRSASVLSQNSQASRKSTKKARR